jgi:hypothetical protein
VAAFEKVEQAEMKIGGDRVVPPAPAPTTKKRSATVALPDKVDARTRIDQLLKELTEEVRKLNSAPPGTAIVPLER